MIATPIDAEWREESIAPGPTSDRPPGESEVIQNKKAPSSPPAIVTPPGVPAQRCAIGGHAKRMRWALARRSG